eukprot:6586887-Ditylum_brightwellii.AAC.1
MSQVGSFVLGEVERSVALVVFEDSAIPVAIGPDPLFEVEEGADVANIESPSRMKTEDVVFAEKRVRCGSYGHTVKYSVFLLMPLSLLQ